jgi:hypothetical protein
MLADYHNPYRLIINMSPNMLRALSISVNGGNHGAALQPAGLGQTTYIEAHVHAGISFNRDIKKLCISNAKVSEAETETRALSANDNSLKVINAQKPRDIFSKFSQKFWHSYRIHLNLIWRPPSRVTPMSLKQLI